jgi:ribonucleoside-diphosphate reductase alpha chain
MGLKALAIYRDGSKQSQPLSTKNEGDKAKKEKEIASAGRAANGCPTPASRSRTSSTSAATKATSTSACIPTAGPGELFITMAKEGSTVGGLMDCFGTAISMSLQYGVPLEVLVNKFSHTRFEPMGHTTNPDIRIAKSVVDYIFRWLGITFLGEKGGAANPRSR